MILCMSLTTDESVYTFINDEPHNGLKLELQPIDTFLTTWGDGLISVIFTIRKLFYEICEVSFANGNITDLGGWRLEQESLNQHHRTGWYIMFIF